MRIDPFKHFCGNHGVQRMLGKAVRACNRQRGIGTGGGIKSSGERTYPRLVRRRCRAPFTIFDVGANKGQFLEMMLGGMRGDEVTFHVFEPSAATFGVLHERFGNVPGVTLNQQGMGRESGTLTLYSDSEGSELASLTKRNIGYLGIDFDHAEEVEITTVDPYCAANSIERIDLLKLDVEGHELDVLRGAQEMLSNGKVSLVAFEFGGCNIDTRTNLKDFYDCFESHNMALHRLTPTGYLWPIKPYRVHEEFYDGTLYIACLGE